MKTGAAPDFENDCAAAVRFARVAALSPPALPPELAERIIRDVPRLAQMPAPARLPIRGGALRVIPLVRVVPGPPARHTSAGRRLIAGWSALAAGIAAVALMLPQAFPARPVVALHRAAAVPPQPVSQRQIARAETAPVPRLEARLQAQHAIRAHFVSAPVPAVAESNEAIPTPQAVPLPGVIAVALAEPVTIQPSRPVYGPVDTEAASTGTHGGPGSGQTPGFAFSGGAHQ